MEKFMRFVSVPCDPGSRLRLKRNQGLLIVGMLSQSRVIRAPDFAMMYELYREAQAERSQSRVIRAPDFAAARVGGGHDRGHRLSPV